jgi:hypothetical protein
MTPASTHLVHGDIARVFNDLAIFYKEKDALLPLRRTLNTNARIQILIHE